MLLSLAPSLTTVLMNGDSDVLRDGSVTCELLCVSVSTHQQLVK